MPALVASLAAAAWAMLWLWSASPYARYVDHGSWTESGLGAQICRVLPAGELVLPALLYAAAWVLMIFAMMLPTTLPVLNVFRRIVAGRPGAGRLYALLIAGYVAAWGGFGLGAHLLDLAVHEAARGSDWVVTHGWVVGAAVIGGAGLFQFSALKYRCLEKCRTPYGFVVSRWHGKAPTRDALRIGVEHGLFCVGCCWALMLLMFVVGTASLGWMLVLAAVMAIEKNVRGGRRLSVPLGAALLAWSGLIVATKLAV